MCWAPGRIYTKAEPDGALRQGEIITDLRQTRVVHSTEPEDKWTTLKQFSTGYAIVVSQDCDLAQDYDAKLDCGTLGSKLPAVLVCQLVPASSTRKNNGGELDSKRWKLVQRNRDVRYHYFEAPGSDVDHAGEELPELVADFRQYFTVDTTEIYRRLELTARRRCRLVSPYLEHFTTRFANFLSRVALPEDHASAKE